MPLEVIAAMSLPELLAIIGSGKVTVGTVASSVGGDERSTAVQLDEQVRTGRIKGSGVGRGRTYELTPDGKNDLAGERLTVAILREFAAGGAASIAGMDERIARALGFGREEMGNAYVLLETWGWIAAAHSSGADSSRHMTAAGRKAWATIQRTWPHVVAGLPSLVHGPRERGVPPGRVAPGQTPLARRHDRCRRSIQCSGCAM